MSVCVDFKKLLSAAILVNVIVLLALIKFQELELGLNYDTLSATGTLAAVTWLLWTVFKNWLWKLPFLQTWLVKIPNLNGQWRGSIKSTWIDPATDEGIDPISVEAVIRQTLTRISIDFQTGEMDSQSVVADISCDEHRRVAEIRYVYQSEPDATVRGRSQIHFGAAKLSVKQSRSALKLKGDYWTDRKTTGSIELTKQP